VHGPLPEIPHPAELRRFRDDAFKTETEYLKTKHNLTPCRRSNTRQMRSNARKDAAPAHKSGVNGIEGSPRPCHP
jgi:hypothetical protein